MEESDSEEESVAEAAATMKKSAERAFGFEEDGEAENHYAEDDDLSSCSDDRDYSLQQFILASSAMGNEAVLLSDRISLVEKLLQNSELQQNVSRGTIEYVLQIKSDHPINTAEYLKVNWRKCIETLQSIQQHHQQQDDAIFIFLRGRSSPHSLTNIVEITKLWRDSLQTRQKG